jgi:hypothetical protein
LAITYKRNIAVFEDVVGVEEAEVFLAWIQKHPKAKLDLASCTHIHAAQLQVLMAARPPISAWPLQPDLSTWLKSALPYDEGI